MRNERQEIHCHNCQQYVQFTLDVSLNGNHVLNCPKCGHEHCRVVSNGVITGERWAQRNGPTYQVVRGTVTTSSASTWDTYATASTRTASTSLYSSWMDSTTVVIAY